ncbi:hypothetical protein Scep_001734 [Stephania cephalantha]|uniref:Uncharacterized protein n=1 Tax=Stephania cephalantha TaxID=152367 RepID=A0AAP0L8M8_9MAGN
MAKDKEVMLRKFSRLRISLETCYSLQIRVRKDNSYYNRRDHIEIRINCIVEKVLLVESIIGTRWIANLKRHHLEEGCMLVTTLDEPTIGLMGLTRWHIRPVCRLVIAMTSKQSHEIIFKYILNSNHTTDFSQIDGEFKLRIQASKDIYKAWSTSADDSDESRQGSVMARTTLAGERL